MKHKVIVGFAIFLFFSLFFQNEILVFFHEHVFPVRCPMDNWYTPEHIVLGLVGFYSDTGRFPTNNEGLSVLCSDHGIAGWNGPYVMCSIEELHDQWGYEFTYEYSIVGDEAKVISRGLDGIPGNNDDKVSTVSGKDVQGIRQAEHSIIR